MAACQAAQRGRKTLLLEKKRRPGTKLLLSGGTRCNLTHATDARGIVAAFGDQGRFLHSALAALGPEAVVALFEAEGVATKIEDGGKVFPRSDRAGDVLAALLARLRCTPCTIALDEPVVEIRRHAAGFQLLTARRTLLAQSLVLATGGRSYPESGSTGDGYLWAAALGHTIITPHPALVPVITHARAVLALQGITLADAGVSVLELPDDPRCATAGLPSSAKGTAGQAGHRAKHGRGTRHFASASRPACLARQRGAILFAHFGVSGPAVLDVSRAVSGHPRPDTLLLRCDFLPEVKQQSLESALQEECGGAGRRLAVGLLAQRLPQRLAEAVAEQAGLASGRRAAELSRSERHNLARTAKQFDIPLAGTLGFRKAEVTAGGVSLAEVDSRTMQSRLAPGLFFAGELLDLDGPIGGYNFQAAFSTGWLAGKNA
jgi:hypothetical protein